MGRMPAPCSKRGCRREAGETVLASETKALGLSRQVGCVLPNRAWEENRQILPEVINRTKRAARPAGFWRGV